MTITRCSEDQLNSRVSIVHTSWMIRLESILRRSRITKTRMSMMTHTMWEREDRIATDSKRRKRPKLRVILMTTVKETHVAEENKNKRLFERVDLRIILTIATTAKRLLKKMTKAMIRT